MRRRPLMASSISEVGPLRVLVVEPDWRTRSLLEVGLARAGSRCWWRGTVVEAQEHLGVGRALPGMLVCETDLAGEDGFRFCSQLRSDLRTAHLPVVLLSQRPEAFHLEMASGAGADDYLPKPVFLNDVISLARLKAGQSASTVDVLRRFRHAPARSCSAPCSPDALGTPGARGRKLGADLEHGCVVDARFEGHRGELAVPHPHPLQRALLGDHGALSLLTGEMPRVKP